MKPIKYAKSVCLSILYIAIVSMVFYGVCKLLRSEITLDGYTLTLVFSSILLHFMHEEDKEEEQQ